MSKLIIAKYDGNLISVNDYIHKVHQGKLTCPFCEDLEKTLKVKYDKRGYFAAWQGEGGHICGRGCLTYLDSDWEGSQLVEIIASENTKKEIIIDLFNGFNHSIKKVKKPDKDCKDREMNEGQARTHKIYDYN